MVAEFIHITKGPHNRGPFFYGALGGIRTPGPQVRSLMLYPTELRALLTRTAHHTTIFRIIFV